MTQKLQQKRPLRIKLSGPEAFAAADQAVVDESAAMIAAAIAKYC